MSEQINPARRERIAPPAHHCMRTEKPDHILQTTALVNETYLKLVDQKQVAWKNRAQFMGVAAKLMRQILQEAVQAIRDTDPAPLGSIKGSYRGDIETIVDKALEKDKERRYASASDLAADIRRYLSDQPIVAHPASATYQLQKFARRHKGLVTSVSAVLLVLLGGAILSTWEAVRANRAEARALSERDRASRLSALGEQSLSPLLSFEDQREPGFPRGWNGGPSGTIFADNRVVHGGRWSARIDRTPDSPFGYSELSYSIPVNFTGRQLELRGFLKTEEVSDFSGLLLREDADSEAVNSDFSDFFLREVAHSETIAEDEMHSRALHGITGWTEYSITLPLAANAKMLSFGFVMGGSGRTWADDLVLLLDGKPLTEVAKITQHSTILDRDHEFDSGSGIKLNQLTPAQIDNLTLLGMVWGFLKYNHPRVTAGEHHWDYDLFRILPAVLAAPDRPTAAASLVTWIDSLGDIPQCVVCAQLSDSALQMRPDLRWISNVTMLGNALRDRLQNVYRNRSERQFYIALGERTGKPFFEHEPSYSLQYHSNPGTGADAGFQILGLFRFWNAVEYWFPYRDLLGKEWHAELREFIPKVALAPDANHYGLALVELTARLHDLAELPTLWTLRPTAGACEVPIELALADGKFVVTQNLTYGAKAAGLEVGDVIGKLDGVPVSKSVENSRPYVGDPSEAAAQLEIANFMTRGRCGPLRIELRRGSKSMIVKTERVTPLASISAITDELPGPAFRLLSTDVAYLRLSTANGSDAARYVEEAANTKGWIIDTRGFSPQSFELTLAPLLIEKESSFVRFTRGDLSNPGFGIQRYGLS